MRSYNNFEKWLSNYWGSGRAVHISSGNGKRSGELTSFVVQRVV